MVSHQGALNTLFLKNPDLISRLQSEDVTYGYDVDHEIFWIQIGEIKEAITESINNSIYLRYDPDSGKVVGIEFMKSKFIEGPA